MRLSGYHTQAITVILVLAAGFVPVAVCFWIGIQHVTAATAIRQGEHLSHLADIKKRQVQDYAAKLLADVQLLSLSAQRHVTKTTAPIEVLPAQVEVVPKPVSPPAETAHPPSSPPQGDGPAGALRDQILRLTTLFLQQQLDNVTLLADNKQLGSKLAGIDWIFRENKHQAGGAKWHQYAKTFTPKLDAFRKARKYHDLYLISTKGDIVYTSARGPELGANITDPGLKGSGLFNLFPHALKQPVLEDVSPYGYGDKHPAAFAGAPIRNGNQLIGIIALRFDFLEHFTSLISEHAGSNPGAIAVIGGDGGLRFNNQAWTQLPASLQTLQALPKMVTETPRGMIIPEGSTFQVSWDRFRVGQSEWTLLVILPVPPSTDPITPVFEPAQPVLTSAPPAPTVSATPPLVPAIPDKGGVEQMFGKNYLEITGYYDLFLVHPDGEVFHTAMGQGDYGTNLIRGPYADTSLGALFRHVMDTGKPALSDIAPYPPSRNEPAAFVAAPVMVDGKVAMVVALQQPLEKISNTLNPGSLMGPGGDIVLVGPDFRMRSDSFLTPQTHSIAASFRGTISDNGMDHRAVQQALAGQQGLMTTPLPHGGDHLTAYVPVAIGDVTWALLASGETAPPFATLFHAEWKFWTLMAGGIAWIVLLAILTARLGRHPWHRLEMIASQLATGHTETLQGEDWASWSKPMEPLRQVMERFFLQGDRLRTHNMKLTDMLNQFESHMNALLHTQGRIIAVETEDHLEALPEALLEALARWQQLPVPVPMPSNMAKDWETIIQKLADQLNLVRETAYQISLQAINATSLAARPSTKKITLIGSFQRIRDLSESIIHLANESHEISLSWKGTPTPSTQDMRPDEILSALLGRVREMLTWHIRLMESHKSLEELDWNAIRTLVVEIAKQGQKLQRIADSFPQQERYSPDGTPHPGTMER
ncbi:MAG: cache domain-containing protein [Nitrospirae bacterium]|nr:cache domain-containing protein [Magnetococcales bacterium]